MASSGPSTRPGDAMHVYDPATAELAAAIFEYSQWRLRLDPAPLDGPVPPEALARDAGGTITPAGIGGAAALRIFADVLAPACVSTDSPRFLSFIPAAPTEASLLFDLVVSASSLCGSSWLEAAGAIHAENEALRWVADLAGFPAGAGGCFVAGGTIANLSALVTAREVARARRGSPMPRCRFVVSDQAHSSVAHALRVMDADAIVVATGDDGRLTGAALERIAASDEDPGSICGVVATGGTTNAGIVDELDGITRVAASQGWWVHVDAAYGGAALAAPSARDRFRGVEHVDSLAVDPHKWLFAPYDCAALLYRDPEQARAVHTQHASYLDALRAGDGWNPADYAIHLTRRARGLPFWFSLATHGTDAYRDAVEATLALAREAAARIERAAHVELVREPGLSVVLFRRLGWGSEEYAAWSRRMLAEQRALSTPTRWNGEVVLRWVFVNPRATVDLVDELLASLE